MVCDALFHACLSTTANGHVTCLRRRLVQFLGLPAKELTESDQKKCEKLVCTETSISVGFLFFLFCLGIT